jgi:hypothetical protein
VPVSRPVEGHEKPLPSFEPNMIDNLAQSTTCSLFVMIEGSFPMEITKGLVYPHQTLLDDIQINASAHAMVKVDMVHENVKNMKLKVPPDDTTLTLWDAITRRIQWRTFIDVDPSATASASTTASQLHTAPGSIFLQTHPDQTQPCLSPILEQPRLSPPRTQSTPVLTPDQMWPPTALPKTVKNPHAKTQPHQWNMSSNVRKGNQPLLQIAMT